MSLQSLIAACSAACLLALSPLAQAAPTAAPTPQRRRPQPALLPRR
ncbi:MAG: hypothetical protein ACP5QB_11770 [Thiomonas sp.]